MQRGSGLPTAASLEQRAGGHAVCVLAALPAAWAGRLPHNFMRVMHVGTALTSNGPSGLLMVGCAFRVKSMAPAARIAPDQAVRSRVTVTQPRPRCGPQLIEGGRRVRSGEGAGGRGVLEQPSLLRVLRQSTGGLTKSSRPLCACLYISVVSGAH